MTEIGKKTDLQTKEEINRQIDTQIVNLTATYKTLDRQQLLVITDIVGCAAVMATRKYPSQ